MFVHEDPSYSSVAALVYGEDPGPPPIVSPAVCIPVPILPPLAVFKLPPLLKPLPLNSSVLLLADGS